MNLRTNNFEMITKDCQTVDRRNVSRQTGPDTGNALALTVERRTGGMSHNKIDNLSYTNDHGVETVGE